MIKMDSVLLKLSLHQEEQVVCASLGNYISNLEHEMALGCLGSDDMVQSRRLIEAGKIILKNYGR